MFQAEEVTIEISNAWDGYLGGFREIAGGLLTAFMVIAVIAALSWIVVGAFERLAHFRGDGFNKVVSILITVCLVGSLVSGVTFFSEKFGSLNFSITENNDPIDLENPLEKDDGS